MPTRHPGPDHERRALDVFIKLNRACLSVNRRVHGHVREAGLTAIQFGVLETLHHAGPLPITAIAERNLCSQNSMCSVIDTMERNGLVVRRRLDTDRRVVQVDLTPEGQALFDRLWPDHVREIVGATAALSAAELELLNDLLRRLGRGE